MSTKVQLSQANLAQLQYLVGTILALPFEDTETKAQLLAKASDAGFAKQSFDYAEAPDAPKPTPTIAADAPVTRDTVKIRIPREDKAGGKEPVFVSVNGRAMYIPRGEECEIGVEYLEVLNNAVAYVYEATEQSGLGERSEVPQIPVQRLS